MLMRRTLREWYEFHGRQSLPWRQTQDPYAIWVSEIMLQQTQVKTVRDRFYEPFLQRFPTLSSLAEAEESEVLKAWEGLGYYSRARNMHRAARQTSPQMPRSVEGLLALPGIGRNTAHAVASFAYNAPFPVMEANVKRIISRIFAQTTPSDSTLWEGAALLLDTSDPFTHNQAMMDIGAMICIPRAPRCGECPLATLCLGKTSPESYPARKPKKVPPTRHHNWWVIHRPDGRFYMRPRTTRLLGGLYGFPESPAAPKPDIAQDMGTVRHTYSHFTREATLLWLPASAAQSLLDAEPGGQWVNLGEARALATSGADQKAFDRIAQHLASQPGQA